MTLEQRRHDADVVLIVLAAGAASGAVVADVVARTASIGSPWALLSGHLVVAAIVVVAVALVGAGVEGGAGAALRRWRLVAAVASLVALLAVRAGAASLDPVPKSGVALLVVAPALLGLEVWTLARSSGFGVLATHARAWCHAAVVASAWALLAPTGPRWVHVDRLELAVAGAVLVLGGVVELASPSSRRPLDVGARRVAVVGAGAHVAAGLWLLTCDRSSVGDRAGGALVVGILGSVLVTTVVADRASQGAAKAGSWSSRASKALLQRAAAATSFLVALGPRAVRTLHRSWVRLVVACAPADPVERSLTRADRVAGAAMAAASVAFVGLGVAWAARVGWQPTGHSATVMARAYDVGTRHHPLVGMITSLGNGDGNHPGPMLFDLLAPLVRLFGLRWAAYVGGALLTLVTWWIATWCAWRAAGRAAAVLAWTTSALVIEIAALGAVWEANNVSATMLAMFATAMAAWAAATGTWRAWWLAVLLGSLCSQAYLPHGLVVIGPVLWSGLALAGARRRAGTGERARRIASAVRGGWVIAAVCWSQPLIDVLINDGGNVRSLAEQVSDPRPPVGAIGIPRTIAWMCTIPPRWSEITSTFARAGIAMDFIGGSMVVGLVVAATLVFLAVWTRRRIDGSRRQLRIIVVLVTIGAVVNVSQLPQERLRSFALGWLVVASLLLWFAVAYEVVVAVHGWLGARAPRALAPARVTASVAAAGIVLVAALAGPSSIADMKGAEFTIDAMVDPLVSQVMSSDRAPRGQTLVLGMDTMLNQVTTDTLVSNLIVEGMDVRLERGPGLHYGASRLVLGDWSGPTLWVVSAIGPLRPPGVRIATASLPGWSRSRFDAVAGEVGRWADEHPALTLEPWALRSLPAYLAGWRTRGTCSLAASLQTGEVAPADLPPEVLTTLIADEAIAAPRVPEPLRDRAARVVGRAPIEVWRVDLPLHAPISTDALLRDGSSCPTPA